MSLVSPESLPAIAGRFHVLRCIANRSQVFSPSTHMQVVWLNPQNNAISHDDNLFGFRGDTLTNSSSLSSELLFNHVLTSLAGPYTCAVHVTVPEMATNYTVSGTLNFTIQSESNVQYILYTCCCRII